VITASRSASLDGIEYEKFVYQPNMKKAAMATHDHDA